MSAHPEHSVIRKNHDRKKLEAMSVDELVQRFIDIALSR